ncbi:hypothetical protein AS188_04560 [Kocuria flava]|uniref:Gluconate 2-dehydrogenase subunit 3 family protein n=1 Tax=Kocuria flava TaxID=446860 RepID=A0A0U3HD96_9MICC|nr:hypothetical protein [Kocuria flava]ALU39145.1 hypothetical protein AS188_04560 [Kocuria flava]MCJ8504562.1 hypothetical protein [Kocuria flava]GEO90907.1 hypothetical protein KFL01_02130 [Kocuria flava]
MVYPAKYSALNALALTDEAKRTLTRIIRVAFPHPGLPDGPYERMTEKIVAEAESSTWFRMALTQGLLTIDSLSDRPFVELDDDTALKVLKRIADLEFFGFVRRTTVLHLYDDHEVWEALGYEGESFSKGGYLHRGFDDLDWLPDPRVEESEEELVECGPLGYEVATAAPPEGWNIDQQGASETTDQPFSDLFKGSETIEPGETA